MIEISVDASEIKQIVSPMATSAAWIPHKFDKHFPALGRKIAEAMKNQVRPRRYTGALEGSITFNYDPSKVEVVIGPQAKRGNYDAGLILQQGTRPANVPWRPIGAWAMFRNRTSFQARAIWLGIRAHGVAPHPFLTETLNRGDVQRALEETAEKVGLEIAAHAISGKTMLSGTIITP